MADPRIDKLARVLVHYSLALQPGQLFRINAPVVAADLIRTITSKPSLEDAAILGLIVLIRTVLSFSIQVEIEGVAPWRRALLRSGGQMLGDAVSRDRAATTSPPPAAQA